jgi:hypothetical protein
MIRPGEVVWYVTGRFYVADDMSIRDAGTFLHLQGIDAPLAGRLTFLSEPFRSMDIENGALKLGIDTVGSFSVYLQETSATTYDDPSSFGQGECVATFRRMSIVVGTHVGSAVTLNTFSAKLTASCPFELDGQPYDFARLLPHGITQWGTASPEPVSPPPAGFTTVAPFVGSAIAF